MYFSKKLKVAALLSILLLSLSFAGCGGIKLKAVDTMAAKVAIEKIKAKPTDGGLEFKNDLFFEDDATIALGSAWLTTRDMAKAKIFFFGLDEVKPSGGKVKDVMQLVVKKDGKLDVGITDVFGATLTESNAITVTITKRSMITSVSPAQLQKWAESAAKLLDGNEAYVAFATKITENVITTEEFTTENYKANLALSAIKIGDATYGSSRSLKTTEPVLWVGLTGCKWRRAGADGKPSITVMKPAEFKKILEEFNFKM